MPDLPSARAVSFPDFSELKSILDAVGTMIVATDADGIVRTFNPAAERLLGWRADEVVGKQTPAIWHVPAEVAAQAAELSRKLGRTVQPGHDFFRTSCLEGNGQPSQWTLVRKDGRNFPVQLAVAALRDNEGRVTGYVGTAQDLTEHVQAAHVSDRLFELSLDLLCIANADGYFKRVNPAFTRTLGWSEAELLARPFIDFVHPDDRAATQREVERQVATGQPVLHFENRYQQKDGAWRVLAWKGVAQPGGVLYGTARDVTDSKLAEEALRSSEQHLAITLDAIGDAVITTDAARRVMRMNPVAEQLTGWPRDEALGRPIEEVFQIVNEQTWQPAVIPVDAVLATGEIHGLANHTVLISRDGTEWPIADSAAPIRDHNGHIFGIVLVFRDVTEERRHEQELEQLNADLERRVEEHTRELAESDRCHRMLLTNLPGMAYRCRRDADWTMEFVSNGCRELLGISPETLTGGVHTFASLIHPDDLPAVAAGCEVGLQSQKPMVHEYRVVLPDGQTKWVWEQARGIYRDDGTVEAIEGFITDVTDRRSAVEALQQNQNRLALAVEAGEFGIWDVNLRTGSAIWNDFAFRQLGYEPSPDSSANIEMWRSLVLADDLSSVMEAVGKAQQARSRFWSEHRLRRADNGEIHWYAVSGRFFYDEHGQAIQLLGVMQNISDRKLLQIALEESERFNRTTLDALAAHVAVLDESGRIVATNRAWRNFAQANATPWQTVAEGTNYLEICGQAAAAGDADASAAARAIRQVLSGEQSSWLHEYPCHSANEQRWFYCRVTRFPGDGPVHVVVAHENITAMKQAQEQLSEARSRFDLLARVSPVAIMFFDRDGNCIEVNDRCCEMSGVSRAATLGSRWLSAVHPEDRTRVESEWNAAIQVGEAFHCEFRFLHPNGDILWVVSQGVPIHDAHGVSGFLRVSTDVTDQKLIEDTLRTLSLDLAGLSGQLYYERVTRELGRVLNCEFAAVCQNDPHDPGRFVTLAWYEDGQIRPNFSYGAPGTPCADIRNQDGLVIASGVAQQYPLDLVLMEKGIESYAGIPLIGNSGRRFGHLVAMSQRPFANVNRVQHLMSLFAVAVAAEFERETNERRFSDFFELSPDAVFITDANGTIVQANRQVATVFGWTPEELIGQPVEALMPANLRTGHPELRRRYLESALPRAMGSGRTDLLGMRKDGHVFPVDISLSPMHTPDGLLVAAAVRDVTERQQVLKALQSTADELRAASAIIEQERAQLADRVAERTAELTAANEQLIQASRFKSEFLASMSHELRTPLNGVLGMNELLLKTPLTDKQREFIDASSTSGRALLSLINDVLDISKIEAGKIELDLHGSDLEALAYDVITMFAYRAKQKGVSLSCRLDPETCVTVMCDDTRLRQILVNLLGNALKFTATGSVILESQCIQRDDRQIVVRLSVTDTGLGIPDDKLHRLFSPFSQVDSSTSRHYGGTGLGLSITKQLVELMGGTLGVTSRLGVGSTFWIEIAFDLINAEVKTGQRKQLLNGTKVLAVDGVDRERRQIADCLESWGCPFQHVGTLREAVDAVAQAEAEGQPFAVILADCRLAIGDEFVHLQSLARHPNVPVIGLGIGEGNDLATHLRQIGLRHLLRDPVRPSALFNALTSVLAVTPPTASPKQKSDNTTDEQAPTFTGHILVAEDNSINQMFVRELLKHFGCTCDIANNGDEVLTALQQKRYDLALMDCQMPEMDGFTAAREIRRREAAGERAGRLPIIALTANALKGDRERCLEAGMDDYLTKPLQAAQLQAMLARYLSAGTAKPTT